MANITLLPSAKVPLIYDGELTMTTEWYRFFWNIYGFTGTGVVPVNKGGTGLDTIGDHQLIIGNANNVFEPALMRGFGINVTYDPGFVNLSLGASGVTPGTYGTAAAVGQFTIDQYGIITFAQNVNIGIDASQIISGTLPVIRGGTGQSTYTDGQLLIGNSTGNTLTKATLTAGTGISVTNGAGSITIGNTGVLSVSGTAPVVSSGGATPAISMAAANTTTNGYLTSTDWNTFNNKAPATSGTSILYGNGSGGFSNVTIGSGISFAGGTLSATGSGGTVTSVTGTSPVISSGGTTPAISLATAYGDTLNPYASKTANYFLAAPNGSAGVPTFRAMAAADVPALAYVTSVSGTGSVNGITLTGTVTSSGSLTLGGTLSGIGNSQLTNSTISGVALGGSLFNLTAGTGVSFSAGTTYNGSTAITINATGSGGTVTSVTGTAPVVSSGGATPAISMAAANTTTDGYLTSTDWNTFNGKQPAFTYTTNYIPYGQGTTTPLQSSALTYNGTTLASGSGTIQYAPKIGVRFAGNNYEWGHTNTAGYGSTLGAEAGSGTPFIAFNAGAGTNSNTYKTFGIAGSVIKSNLAGGFGFYSVATASADNQSLTQLATLSSSGVLTLGTALATSYGGTGLAGVTANRIPYGNGTNALSTSANLYFSGTQLGVGTSTTFATISAELTGGNVINARYNSGNPRAGIYVGGSSGSTFFGSNLTYSSGNVFNYDKTGTAWFIGDAAGTGFFSIGVATGTAGTSAGTDTTANLRLNINTSGNVGIGTTAPTAKLSVANPSGSYGSTNPNFSLLYSTTEYFNAYMDGNWVTHLSAPAITGQTVGIAFDTVGSERMRIHASGGVSIGNTTDPGATNLSVNGTGKFGTTVGVGNATPSTSGAGITFPATQSASTDVNTLDDYEEGTWTPTITPSSGTFTFTYVNQYGYYTKIGNQVTATCYVRWSAFSQTGAGYAYLSGLPFTVKNAAGNYGSAGVGFYAGLTLAVGTTQLGFSSAPNQTFAYFYCSGSGVADNVVYTIAATGEIAMTLTYYTA